MTDRNDRWDVEEVVRRIWESGREFWIPHLEDLAEAPPEAQGLWGKIKAGFNWLGRAISEGIISALTWWSTALPDVLISWGTGMAISVGNAVAVVLYPVSILVSRVFTAALRATPAGWIPFVESYITSITGKPVDLPKAETLDLTTLSTRFSKTFSSEVFQHLLGTILPTKEELARNPYTFAERFLNMNFRFQMDSFVLHMFGELLSFGQMKWTKDLPLNISWALGLGWLSWLVFSVPFRIAATTPMEYNLNWVYRLELPSVSQLIDMYLAEMIDEEDLDTYLGARGYAPYWIERMVLLSAPKLSDAELRTLYNEGVITEDDVREYLRLKGFPQKERAYKLSLITRDRLRDLRDKIISEAMDLFTEGVIPESQLRDFLTTAGWKREEIDLAVSWCEMRKRKARTLTPSQIKQAWKKNLITLAEARRRLIELGYSPEDVDIFMEL